MNTKRRAIVSALLLALGLMGLGSPGRAENATTLDPRLGHFLEAVIKDPAVLEMEKKDYASRGVTFEIFIYAIYTGAVKIDDAPDNEETRRLGPNVRALSQLGEYLEQQRPGLSAELLNHMAEFYAVKSNQTFIRGMFLETVRGLTMAAPPPANDEGATAAPSGRATTTVFLGSFYSERFTEEHEYRNQIDLWGEGQHVFGLTWDIAGLSGDQVPMVGRFEGTLAAGTGALSLSNRFRGALTDSTLIGVYESGPDDPVRLQRSSDRMETNPTRAPLNGYEAWQTWADSLIDASEARSPYLQQEAKKCEGGDGWACVGIGNRLRDRKPEEAKRYWERACELDAWPGCKFLGDQARYQAALRKLCASNVAPSLHRNMACEELGAAAEKAGKLKDAVKWYKLGCNDYALPTTSCARLKALQAPSKNNPR